MDHDVVFGLGDSQQCPPKGVDRDVLGRHRVRVETVGKGVREGPPKPQSDHNPEDYNRAYWKADQAVSEDQGRRDHIFLLLLGTEGAERQRCGASRLDLGTVCGCNEELAPMHGPHRFMENNKKAGEGACVVDVYHGVIINA